jgi:hypothetical protein
MTTPVASFADARSIATTPTPCRAASFVQFGVGKPQMVEIGGSPTWVARGANFVVAVTLVEEGQELVQLGVPDESMLLLTPATPMSIISDDRAEEVIDEAVVVLPPGSTRLIARGSGCVVRVFSSSFHLMCRAASNAASYSGDLSDTEPLRPWPEPVGGFNLRTYRLKNHTEDVGFGRLFRSTNLMVNVFEPTSAPRDPHRLSPHEHADFEQGSLTLGGDFHHHLRSPWGPDSTSWREDRHIPCSELSLVVIPPRMIHTTTWNSTGARLVDIFAPPRADFSLKPNWVRNAADYPLPDKLFDPGSA